MTPIFEDHAVSRAIMKPLSIIHDEETPVPEDGYLETDLVLPETINILDIVRKIQARAEDVIKLIGPRPYGGFLRSLAIYEGVVDKDYPDEAIAEIQEMVVIQIKTILTLIFTAENKQKAERRADAIHRKNGQLREINAVLDRQVRTDPLTNLYNKSGLEKEGKKVFEYCQEKNIPLSCLFIDADYFKLINDTHGHAVGDAVLKRLAEIIMSEFRGSDITFKGAFREGDRSPVLGRDGGEEFIVLMPYTNIDEAALAAERLRKRIQNERINIVKTNGKTQLIPLDLTCTIGVYQADFTKDTSIEDIKSLADNALKFGKQQHRNIVSVAEPDSDDQGISVNYPFLGDPARKAIKKIPRYFNPEPEDSSPEES